jgi:PAS domain S-box-containing protein
MRSRVLYALGRQRAFLSVLVLGSVLSLLTWGQVDQAVRQQNRTRFQNTIDTLHRLLQERIDNLEELAYSGQVLFNSSEIVEPGEWATFIRTPYEALRSPALLAFGYARTAGAAGRHRIKYCESPAARQGRVGRIISIHATRPPATDRRFDRPGNVVDLASTRPPEGTPCALLALPHVRPDGRLAGWIFLQFRFDRLLAESVAALGTQFDIHVESVALPGGLSPPLSASRRPPGRSPLERKDFRYTGRMGVDVLGQDQAFDVRGHLSPLDAPVLFLPWFVLLSGLCLTAIASFLVWRITQRHQETQRELDRIFRLNLDLLCVADMEGRFLRLNPAWERVLGYRREEVVGRHFIDFVHPDDVGATREAIGELARGNDIIDFINRYRARDGSWRWIEWRSTPFRGRRIYAAARDITEKRMAEEERMRTLDLLKRHNRELQDFAFVASHDLQEPLRKIQSFAGFLQEELGTGLPERAADYLRRMTGAAVRMQSLIEGLLTFSRITTQARPFERVEMDRVLREVVSDLEVLLSRTGGRVEADSLPALEGDPTQMRQLLQNLLGNALKFHREGVPPVVQVRATIGGEPPRYRLTVSDNGIGIEERFLERIFAIFQRLHGRGEYEGTGIGLAICRRIAERHGGTITARSAPGSGSTFTVELPVGRAREDAS